jgi:hypothetical protein
MTTKMRNRLSAVTAMLVLGALVFGGNALYAQTTFTDSNGTTYDVPAGYQSYNSSGDFYNPSTGTYYNAVSGQTSSTAPAGSISSGSTSTNSSANTNSTSNSTSVNPGVPNTGAGGNAAETVLVLVLSSAVALGGIRLLAKDSITGMR